MVPEGAHSTHFELQDSVKLFGVAAFQAPTTSHPISPSHV